MANVGLRPTFVSSVDESGLSADIIARLDACGCDTTYVRSCDDGLGMWLAIFDETGDVVASISRRSNLSSMERSLVEDLLSHVAPRIDQLTVLVDEGVSTASEGRTDSI